MAHGSWLHVDANSSFTLQNIPFGIFSNASGPPRVGSAIGNQIMDLAALQRKGMFSGPNLRASDCFQQVRTRALLLEQGGLLVLLKALQLLMSMWGKMLLIQIAVERRHR